MRSPWPPPVSRWNSRRFVFASHSTSFRSTRDVRVTRRHARQHTRRASRRAPPSRLSKIKRARSRRLSPHLSRARRETGRPARRRRSRPGTPRPDGRGRRRARRRHPSTKRRVRARVRARASPFTLETHRHERTRGVSDGVSIHQSRGDYADAARGTRRRETRRTARETVSESGAQSWKSARDMGGLSGRHDARDGDRHGHESSVSAVLTRARERESARARDVSEEVERRRSSLVIASTRCMYFCVRRRATFHRVQTSEASVSMDSSPRARAAREALKRRENAHSLVTDARDANVATRDGAHRVRRGRVVHARARVRVRDRVRAERLRFRRVRAIALRRAPRYNILPRALRRVSRVLSASERCGDVRDVHSRASARVRVKTRTVRRGEEIPRRASGCARRNLRRRV